VQPAEGVLLMWAVSPMLMGSAAPIPGYVAVGVVGSGGTISPAALGAEVGDLIIVNCPYSASSSARLELTGSSWNNTDYGWYVGYPGRITWKILDATSDIVASNNTYGAAYYIARGASSAAIVVSDQVSSDNEHTASFPSKNASCFGLVVFGQQQAGAANMNPPSGWTDRFHQYYASVFTFDVCDNYAPPSGAHDETFTGIYPPVPHYLLGVEIRA
jgi:hypothetical protein